MPSRLLQLLLLFCLPLTAQDPSPLPNWLQFNIEQRGRFEGFTGLDFEPGRNDAYYLNRLRFNVGLLPADWFRVAVQIQDSREAGRREPVPAKVENTFDIRGAHMEFGKLHAGWLFRAGRQVLEYGNARLIGPGRWSNVPRVFDAARLAYRGDRFRLEWFAGVRATPDADDFDGVSDDDRIAGFYPTFQVGSDGTSFEPYFIWKGIRNQPSESGGIGGKDAYTGGIRVNGPVPWGFSYTVEAALQRGDQAGDDLSAWATTLRVSRLMKPGARSVRLLFEYDYASGDSDAADGKAGTFEQNFPSNHGKYGIADLMGWRNMHGVRAGVLIRLTPRWILSVDYHSFWLATLEDALYRANGTPIVRNPDASSRHAFQELDISSTVKIAPPFELFLGYAHVFPGGFLKESTGGSASTYAYVQFVLTLQP